jgi:hypothetical protein
MTEAARDTEKIQANADRRIMIPPHQAWRVPRAIEGKTRVLDQAPWITPGPSQDP